MRDHDNITSGRELKEKLQELDCCCHVCRFIQTCIRFVTQLGITSTDRWDGSNRNSHHDFLVENFLPFQTTAKEKTTAVMGSLPMLLISDQKIPHDTVMDQNVLINNSNKAFAQKYGALMLEADGNDFCLTHADR